MAAGVASVGVLEAVLRLRDTMSPALDNVAKRMRRFGGQMQRAGKQLSASFTLPIVGAAFAAVQAGESIDKAMRTIAIGTGAAGETLEGLKDSFNAVFSTVPQSADTVATVLADLNTVTAATGPTLERLAVALLDSSRVLGEEAAPNALKFARTLEQFAIPAEHGVEVLDMFFATSQRTGAGMGDLITQAGTFGVVMKNVGFSLDESVALFGALSKGSIAVTRVMPGLNKAFRSWAGEGLDVKAMLVETIEAMKNAGSSTESLSIATEAFGAEGAARLNDAVLEGKFNLEAMTTAVEGTAGAIAESTADTMTFSEHLGVLRNQATTALAPFGNELKRALEGFMPVVQSVAATLNGWATAFAELSTPTKNTILAVGAFVAALGPVILAVGAISLSIGSLIPIVTSFGAFLVGTSSSVGALAGAFALLMTWPGALVAAVVLLTLKFEPFRNLLKATARLIMTGVVAAFAKLREWIGKAADTVGGFLGGLAKFIPGGAAVARAMGRLTAGMDAMSSSMGDSSGAVEGVEASVEELGAGLDWTGGRVPPVVDGIVGLGDAAGTSSEEVQKLADTLSDAGLAGEVRTLTAAWESLDPTMQQNEHTLKRVSERALALIGRGATLTGEVAALGRAAFGAREEGIVPLADGLDGLEIQLGDQTVAMNALGTEMIWAVEQGFGPAITEIDMFRDGIVELEEPIKDFHEALGDTPSFMEQFSSGWAEVPGMITGALMGGGSAVRAVGSHFGSMIGGALSSKVSAAIGGKVGSAIGGMFGPIGAMAGQFIGKGVAAGVELGMKGLKKLGSAIKGLFSRSTTDNLKLTAERMWGIVLTDAAAAAAADAADRVDDSFTGLLLSLGDVIEELGGINQIPDGFNRITDAARDMFSAIDMGKMDADEALGALLPVLSHLKDGFFHAGAEGQANFLELIQLAKTFGLDMDAITEAIGSELVEQALGADMTGALTTLKESLAGVSAEGLGPLMDQMVELGVITEAQQAQFSAMAEETVFDTKRAEEAAGRWGIALEDLGPKFHAARLSERAQTIAGDFAILAASGMPVEEIILAQGDAIHALVRDSRWAGEAIPESMRPVIAAMIEQGTLTDENGNKITDLSEIEFAVPMEERLAGVVASLATLIQDFIDALTPINDVKTGVENIPDANVSIGFSVEPIPSISIPPVNTTINYVPGPIPDVPGAGVPGFQGGTEGRFLDFGRGTLAMLHGREAIVPEGEAGPGTDALAREIASLRRDLSTDRAFQSQLVPKMLAAALQQQGALS